MRSIVFFGALMLMVGCSVKQAVNDNVALTRGMFDAFNRHEWQKMAAYYSDPALFLDPSFGAEYVSKSQTETAHKYAAMERMFPDIHDEIGGIYPSGDKVTVEFISTGSMSDSVKFKMPIVTVLTFKDGLIIKDATYYDQENP